MKIIISLILFIFFVPYFFYLYKQLKFYKKVKAQRGIIHSFAAFDKLIKNDFFVSGLEYPLVFASSLTAFFFFLAGIAFLFFLLAALFGLRLDVNMNIQANIIFNMIFAFCTLAVIIYMLKITTMIILDEKGIKINDHLGFLAGFGRVREYDYNEIDSIEVQLCFGKERKGTHSAGIRLIINSRKGRLECKPNILYNNETLLLIAGLKEKLQGKVEITNK